MSNSKHNCSGCFDSDECDYAYESEECGSLIHSNIGKMTENEMSEIINSFRLIINKLEEYNVESERILYNLYNSFSAFNEYASNVEKEREE